MDQAAAQVALPRALNGPGRWFLLAGFLKVLLLAQLHTPSAVSYVFLGVALPAGPMTLLVTLLAALGLAYISKAVVEHRWLQKRWTVPLVVCASVLLLLASSILFESPRVPAPSPAQLAENQQAAARQASRRAAAAVPRTAAEADEILRLLDQRRAMRQQPRPS